MKKNLKHRMIAMILSGMMISAPVGGTVFAADELSLDQPEKPVATSYSDNDKIVEYNKKVDEYNKSAEKHNESVDREYEAAVEETAKKNAEIDQHNEAEIQRVKTAEENNERALKEAEEANARIDEENASEEARVNEHNRNEEEKVRASEAAKAAAEEENESIKAHNEAVAKYESDKAQYDADLAQYEKDLVMEQKIKAAGYASVEDYNNRINKAYNEPAKKAVEMNASSKIESVRETYKVTEAEEKSGVNVSVNVKHVFEGTAVSYEEAFTIDANDTIVLNSIAALGSATNPGYASFYYNTDEDHSMGYWCESYSELQTTARHAEYGWNCGDEHEVSYSEGKSHANDEEVIEMTYYYFWIPLKTAKTYNTPVAPTELTNPGELKDMVEVPEVYTANYQQFVKKDHVQAELEEIPEANILEHIAAPIKKAYMAILSYMTLFDAPAANTAEYAEEPAETVEPAETAETAEPAETVETAEIIEPAETVEPSKKADTVKIAEAAPAAAASVQETSGDEETTVIAEQEVAMAERADSESPMMIEDNKTPLAEQPAWALLNLILTIVTGLVSALLFAGYFGKKTEEDEDGEEKEMKRKGFARLASIIPAAISVIAFILTENMANPMVLTDRWTIFMAAILLFQAAPAILAKKEVKETEEASEAINA